METEPPSCVYDAAIIMAKYLSQKHRDTLSNKSVLELGAGCGFTSIYLAPIFSRGVLTDIPNIVPLIQNNIT